MTSNYRAPRHSLRISKDRDTNCYSDDDEGKDLGLPLEKLNLGPRKKLVILALNGFLVYRTHRYRGKIPRNRMHDGLFDNHLVYKRPFCQDFMNFCLQRFEIGLWSSGKEHNVYGVLDCVLKELRKRLLFVWDEDKRSYYGFKSVENKHKPLFFKELKKVWEMIKPPDKRGRGSYSASNTLLIDEDPCKGLLNPPNTGIYPEPYDPDNLADDLLDPKKGLGLYLDGLAEAEDVQAYVEAHPFGQPAIGREHKDWLFYSKIRRRAWSHRLSSPSPVYS
ncbi:hypothetical protein Dimus_037380 [Dionaea muscipula]